MANLLALVLGATYIIGMAIAVLFSDSDPRRFMGVFAVALYSTVAVYLVWNADDLGGASGYGIGGKMITSSTPGCLIRIVGWLMLLVPLGFLIAAIFRS